MSLTLLLLLSALSFAEFSLKDAEKQREIAQKAAALADEELPPCEGHDRVDDVTSRFEPPSACPKARELFGYAREISLKIRDNCREGIRDLESLLRTPGSCATDQKQNAARMLVEKIRSGYPRFDEKFPENIENIISEPGLGVDRDGFLEKNRKGGGEFAAMECRQGAAIALTLFRWQTQLAEKHYGYANAQTEDFCLDSFDGGKDYLEYIRYGGDKL